jgi:hypothetical protein
MAIHEVGENPDWKDIRRITQNLLQTDTNLGMEKTSVTMTYWSAFSHVLVAERIDKALHAVQDYMMNAAQHVGKVTESGNRMLVRASERATEISEANTKVMVAASDRATEASARDAALMVAASDRATESAAKQAVQADKQTRSLKYATWMLAGVTAILAFATVALVFYTRELAMNERPSRAAVVERTAPAPK